MPSEVADEPVAYADAHIDEDADLDEAPAVAVAAVDDGEADEDDEVMAAVVVAENDEMMEEAPLVQVEAEAEPAVKKKKKKAPPTTPKSAKTATSSKGGTTSTKKKKKKAQAVGDASSLHISPLYLEAASDARAMLQETVPSLPMPIADITVRSFGRLLIDSGPNNFCTTAALYPIGFSCDRLEFSPTHGRLLKLRCSILDGRKYEPKQYGPLFRIMWGPGVDDNDAQQSGNDTDYPFDPYVHAPPISATPLALADCSTSAGAARASTISSSRQFRPDIGMRVKVKLEKDEFVTGTITAAADASARMGPDGKKKKRKSEVLITIRYDEGFSEDVVFPDPDIELLLPGVDDELASADGTLTDIRGKPVTCVIDPSPLGAWGKALVSLGLIDEMMFEVAFDAVRKQREESLQRAREKLQSPQSNPGSHTKPPRTDRSNGADQEGSLASTSRASSPALQTGQNGDTSLEGTKKEADMSVSGDDESNEPPSERELHMRRRVDELKEDLLELLEENHKAAVELADARISLLGPYLCNPFRLDESSNSQQASWMATTVKKEKMRMGSTGNKKKVVSAVDLLERNDTFFNPDIEALVEGLPGSEYCDSYVFQAFRTAGCSHLNKSWIHEAQLKREKVALVKLKKSQEAQEKEERLKKRKHRDDVRDQRKRQKLEEEDQKKRARIEERLSRLRVQVEERLFNEATFQREKVITTFLKGLMREFVRRRRAAELVAGQSIAEPSRSLVAANSLQADDTDLPLQLSKAYDEDTLRVWDFMASFGEFFMDRGYITSLPTLDSLQSSVETLRGSTSMRRASAIALLTDLAVALCKPLAASLTRTLFASLIALNPNLQKDFGAAFFNEVTAATPTKLSDDKAADSAKTDILLPVNVMTWQEIARASLLSDALGELGLQKHEAAHILRGYRSAGHPNSKEARRLRKIEDIWIAFVRQDIEIGRMEHAELSSPIRVEIPCSPTCSPNDFQYSLHAINTVFEPSGAYIKAQVLKALRLVQEDNEVDRTNVRNNLKSILNLLESAESNEGAISSLKKAQNDVMNLLEVVSQPLVDEDTHRPRQLKADSGILPNNVLYQRRLVGLLSSLSLSRARFRRLVQERQHYMEDALHLKEELKRKESNGEGDDDEDDDEDEDALSDQPKVCFKEESESVERPKTATETGGNAIPAQSINESEQSKIGKPTEYDDFCADIPTAPDLIRRCLAVLRTLCVTSQASSFLYPVDPQSNPGYYDAVIRPICLRSIGNELKHAAEKVQYLAGPSATAFVENTVMEFARNIRLLEQNTLSYANAGPTVVAMASELLRIFERLFFDWVLAPHQLLPRLEDLDDDKCVEPHKTDEEATVLFCDSCEGKYNITLLDPPLSKVPKGDWYCPRCIEGRWWGQLDPRVGMTVRIGMNISDHASIEREGRIEKCFFCYPEGKDENPSLMYVIKFNDSTFETLSLDAVDSALQAMGVEVEPVRCLAALAESSGYRNGVDTGLYRDLVPIPLNPNVADSAAQVALSSSVFNDTLAAASTLLLSDPNAMTANEWMRVLVLLTMKCSSSETIQSFISKIEAEAAENMVLPLEQASNVSDIRQILPDLFVENQPEGICLEKEQACHPNVAAESGLVAVSNGGPDASASIVMASVVEVVEDMDMDMPLESTTIAEPLQAILVDSENVNGYLQAITWKRKRRKAMEDSLSAYCLKAQLKPAISTFQVDCVSQVIDAALSSKVPGLDLAGVRCRRIQCIFCGLTDVALGTPLVRVPDEEQWHELIPHLARNRRVSLIAQIPTDSDEVGEGFAARNLKSVVAVRIRVDGDLFSVVDPDLVSVEDGGMLEFVPRADDAFHHELLFRDESNLPFITGGLSAHECCAVAAHNGRKDLMLQRYKESQAELVEKQFGMKCGRTLELGRDKCGRTYWQFNGELNALFVCMGTDSSGSFIWRRFGDAACIASLMNALRKDKIIKELQIAYPEAYSLYKTGKWVDILVSRRYPGAFEINAKDECGDMVQPEIVTTFSSGDVREASLPVQVGDLVLVESRSGDVLWNATVLDIRVQTQIESEQSLKANVIRVQYEGWDSRYTEWVDTSRILSVNADSTQRQSELLGKRASSAYGIPSLLNNLVAKGYLNARDRARGSRALPDFARIAHVDKFSSMNAITFAAAKSAILAVEAALPLGSIDATETGQWRPEYSCKWRHLVEQADGPARLMACVILLEDTVCPEWIKEDIGHLRATLPARWKAVGEASPSSLLIRILLFDRSILYGTVDRRRFRSRKKKQ